MSKNKRYVILKQMGKTRVLLNNGLSEILEFKSREKAEKIAAIFQENSEQGWTYTVKPVGKD